MCWALLQPSTSSQTSMQPVMYLIIASSLWSSWVMIASLPLVQIECPAVGEPHDLRVGGECAPVHGAGPHSHVLTRFWKFVEKIFLRFSNNKAMREITVRPRDYSYSFWSAADVVKWCYLIPENDRSSSVFPRKSSSTKNYFMSVLNKPHILYCYYNAPDWAAPMMNISRRLFLSVTFLCCNCECWIDYETCRLKLYYLHIFSCSGMWISKYEASLKIKI